MELPPKDTYHIRPFPKQPKRGTKELKLALQDLEKNLLESVPDLERLRFIQSRIHKVGNTFNDDKLVDMLRQISSHIDQFEQNPEKKLVARILEQILKIQVELKRLR